MKMGWLGICVFALLAVVWIIAGAKMMFTALVNRSPLEITLAEYTQTKPEDPWINLTECELNFFDAVYYEQGGRIDDVYIPLIPANSTEDTRSYILLETDDPKYIELVNQVINLQTEVEVLQYLAENSDIIFEVRDVSGVVGE